MSAQLNLPIESTTISKLLPHRYPFLLIDRVLSFEPRKRITAIKNVTCNEPFFTGHFPGLPVMPGVLVIEAMAQAGGVLTMVSRDNPFAPDARRQFFLVKVDNARFSRMVVPGDTLKIEVVLSRVIRNMALYTCTAHVAEELVASADILCAEADG